MNLSRFVSERWDERLHNWVLYRAMREDDEGDVKISSIYSPVRFGRPADGDAIPAMLGDALDTDALMAKLRDGDREARSYYAALLVWFEDKGTRTAQAEKLDVHPNTLRARVDAGKHKLESLYQAKKQAAIKCARDFQRLA